MNRQVSRTPGRAETEAMPFTDTSDEQGGNSLRMGWIVQPNNPTKAAKV